MPATLSNNGVIAANVRRLREERGLTCPAAASAIGMHRSWWNLLETGELNTTVEKLEQVAGLLGVTVRDLLSDPPKKGRRKAS